MKKLLLILLCLPMIGFGQFFGYEGPSPDTICLGDSSGLFMFDMDSSPLIDTPYTFTYTIDGVLQSPITSSSHIIYVQQPGHYVITTWTNSSGFYNSSNSQLPFDMQSPLTVDSCITNTQSNIFCCCMLMCILTAVLIQNYYMVVHVNALGKNTQCNYSCL